jgi:hypothetical protein
MWGSLFRSYDNTNPDSAPYLVSSLESNGPWWQTVQYFCVAHCDGQQLSKKSTGDKPLSHELVLPFPDDTSS